MEGTIRDIFSCVEDEYGAEIVVKKARPRIDRDKIYVFSDPDFSITFNRY